MQESFFFDKKNLNMIHILLMNINKQKGNLYSIKKKLPNLIRLFLEKI